MLLRSFASDPLGPDFRGGIAGKAASSELGFSDGLGVSARMVSGLIVSNWA